MGRKMNMVLLYALGIWFILVVAAILNAGLRESLITPRMGQQAGHVISTITLVCIILLITYLFLTNLNMSYTQTDLILVGVLWLVLTIGFEFGFGHYVMGHSWDKLLADYNLLKGRVWVLVPLTIFIAPLLIGSIVQKQF